jgi:hypothetical protein
MIKVVDFYRLGRLIEYYLPLSLDVETPRSSDASQSSRYIGIIRNIGQKFTIERLSPQTPLTYTSNITG